MYQHIGLKLSQTKKLHKFEALREEVGRRASLNMPDTVLEMSKLRITDGMNVEIPGRGTFSMTDWSKKQLGSMLGVQWDKWFNPEYVTPQNVQEEINRRFSRTGETRKLRTTHFSPDSPGVQGCDGYLRAVLGPTYYAIDDERIFDRLERSFGPQISDMHFMKHLGRERWGNDHAQYYHVIAGEADMGELQLNHPDSKVRDAYKISGVQEGHDYVYHGFNIKNSEVGYTAVIVDEFFFRLVCANGAMVTSGGGRMMYRTHRPIEDAELNNQFKVVFDSAPKQWERTDRLLFALKEHSLPEPENSLIAVLTKLETTKKFQETAVSKFAEEPLPNAYGILNAITRAAQESGDMDKQFEMEELAGRFMLTSNRLLSDSPHHNI
jgi:hypothetical protein